MQAPLCSAEFRPSRRPISLDPHAYTSARRAELSALTKTRRGLHIKPPETVRTTAPTERGRTRAGEQQ